jgi:hypothetical protein
VGRALNNFLEKELINYISSNKTLYLNKKLIKFNPQYQKSHLIMEMISFSTMSSTKAESLTACSLENL